MNFGAIPDSRLTVDLGGAMGLSAYLLPLGAVAAAFCLVLALVPARQGRQTRPALAMALGWRRRAS